MKTACGCSFRFLSTFWNRLLNKPEPSNQKGRPIAETKTRPNKRRHRHSAFFEFP
jgi:hypothetical protein